MIFRESPLKGVYRIYLKRKNDGRGYFERLFCQEEFQKINFKKSIVQINHTFTKKKNTIRGLHYQVPPFAEGKIIICLRGIVFDVAVDLRHNSKTFLKWRGEIISEKSNKIIYIPEGFAHGLQTLTDNCEMLYFHTNFYSKIHERGVRYDDRLIKIKWKLSNSFLSKKDNQLEWLPSKFSGIRV